MRALAAAIALSLLTIAALAASPQVEAALKVFQTVGTDADRLKAFCELMQTDEKNAEKPDPSLARIVATEANRRCSVILTCASKQVRLGRS